MKIAPMLLSLALILPACAQQTGSFPSLARRPVEARDFSEPPPAPPQPIVADSALEARIAALQARRRSVAAGFDSDATKAERLGRAGGARTVGSDAWLDAQTALAALDDWRAQATGVASDAAAAGAERAATLAPPYPALDAVQRAAATEIERQDTVLGRLQAALPGA